MQNKGLLITKNEKVILNGVIFIEVSLDNANRAGEVRHLKLKDYRDGVLKMMAPLSLPSKIIKPLEPPMP